MDNCAPRIRCPHCHESTTAHLSTRAAARRLCCSERTVRNLLGGGALAGYRVASRWQVCPQAILGYIRANHNRTDPYAEQDTERGCA